MPSVPRAISQSQATWIIHESRVFANRCFLAYSRAVGMRARTHPPSLAPGAPGRARSPQAPGAGAARLQLLQRQVGNRTVARMFNKGFWILEAEGTYTWHAGTDSTGFVPSGLPNYKSKESWFAWPVYRRPASAATVDDQAQDEVEASPAESVTPSQPQQAPAQPLTSDEPAAVPQAAAALEEVPNAAAPPQQEAVPLAVASPQPEAVPLAVASPQPEAVPLAVASPQPEAVPLAVASPQPVLVAQPPPAAVAPARAIDYRSIGESIVNLAIAKFQRDYRFSGPEVRVSDCTGIGLRSLDPHEVFAATRRALSGLNPGTEIFDRRSNQKFTAAGGGPNGSLGGHKGSDFNIKVKKLDKEGRARQDVKAEAQVHVRWL
jgi:hypothetical protein